jgi:hypothetical protein
MRERRYEMLADGAAVVESAVPEPPPSERESPSFVLNAAFEAEEEVREVLARQLPQLAKVSERFATRAKDAFASFAPTAFTEADRRRRTYLGPDDDLAGTMRAVVDSGVAALRDSADRRSLRVHVGDELERLATGTGKIPLKELIEHLKRKLGDAPTLRNDATRTACDAEEKADVLLHAVEGGATAPDGGAGPTDTSPNGAGDGNFPSTNDFVKKHVHALVGDVASPERQVEFATTHKRAGLPETEHEVETFQLRAGASDVTSYHDFHSLQIAFEHVWTEIFDGSLKALGEELFREAAKLETYLRPGETTNLNFPITSIPDLQRLLGTIRELNGLAADPVGQSVTVQTGRDAAGRPITRDVAVIPGAQRLSRLLDELDLRLHQRYAFTVFAKHSVNFGIMVTYRQTWRPEHYQVGELVSTIPLAPRETRRYTTKRVARKTRAAKEVEDALRTTRTESAGTSRVEREIVDKAQNQTNFDLTTHGSIGGEQQGYKADATAKAGGWQAAQSEKTKKHFHEAVLKSAEDYKQQHRLEVDTMTGEESEDTTFHEIQNPNDELTVTYLLYELQRTYRISERIHQLTPVILVANEVTAPDAIDDAWLIAHDWILRRVILDDSFKPALDYLAKSYVGAELNIQVLEANARAQKQLVDDLKTQITTQIATLDAAQRDLNTKSDAQAGAQMTEGILGTIKRVFDPLQLTGKEVTGTTEGMQTVVDVAQERVDRAEREKARLLDMLGGTVSTLQVAIDRLSAATKEHYDRIAEIDRLRLHVKDNILFYMQAIWSHEPPDQRFFRIYNIDVPVVEPSSYGPDLQVSPASSSAFDLAQGRETATVNLGIPPTKIETKKLVEVADLDTVLGYKGNYAIYALSENNYLTLHMMQDYLELSDELRLRDPDEFGDYTVAELQKLATCMRKKSPETYQKYRSELRELIIKRLISGRAEDDRVIVPTTSLYMEALVGAHPLLEDFKLIHRGLDVKKVQAEVRHLELENIRLGARALKGKDDDPDIEKHIVIDNGKTVVVDTD